MTRNRDYAYLGITVLAFVSVVWLVAPLVPLPASLQQMIERILTQYPPTLLGLGAAGLVVMVALWRGFIGTPAVLDRSPLTTTPPERAVDSPVPSAATTLEQAAASARREFTDPSQPERRVAMYGRRATHSVTVPKDVETFLDELAVTARDTHATATGCDLKTAADAVRTGTWTDDRVAAAFLATEIDAEPQFAIRERLLGWLAPAYTFDARIERTLGAIEATGEMYLTYEADGRDTPAMGAPASTADREGAQ